MGNDYLIKSEERECPFCNKTHLVEIRKRMTQGLLKGEIVDYEEIYYLCRLTESEENEFSPAGIMDENLLRARDAYRIKHGLLTSGDIAKIRAFYGVSQSDFSAMFGWGDITITRYESKTIQDETYDNIMRMSCDNPIFALENLDKHKSRFDDEKYERIRKNMIEKIDQSGNTYLKMQEISGLYMRYHEKSEYNGYKQLDLNKLVNVIGYFSNFTNNLYKVKLMKLLWYTDALYFKKYSVSMTGLVYKHMPLGALPIAYEEIIHLPAVKTQEEIINDDIAYKILPNREVNITEFTLDELNVLESVARKFKDYNTKQIVDYMHNEKAYTDTEEYQIIPYSLAKEVMELN